MVFLVNLGILPFLFKAYFLSGGGDGALWYPQIEEVRDSNLVFGRHSSLLLLKIMLFICVFCARHHTPEYIRPEKCSDTLFCCSTSGNLRTLVHWNRESGSLEENQV